MHQDRDEQRRLLGVFVRTHRERLTPAAAGLPDMGARRRTPGLRREEAAQLSRISVTWLTWIEQGREVSVSPQALGRLAETLRLTRAERAYLFELAGRRDPAGSPEVDAAPAALAAAVARFEGPAYGLDRSWNACAWNGAAERLFSDWLKGAERNLLRYVFLAPAARRFIVDWEDRARRVLAEFRADFSRSLGDPQMAALQAELRARSPLFARWWDEQAVMAREGGPRRFDHPQDGPLVFEQFTFHPAERPDCKLVLLMSPAGAMTARALEPHQGDGPPAAPCCFLE
jgi:transcriptional regulator with XRE-family HTH domain